MAITGRAGSQSERKSRDSNLKHPDSGSITTKKRKNRGWKSLQASSRIHRRAHRRSVQSLTQYGKILQPGEKLDNGSKTFTHTGGGSIKYH